MGKFIKITTMTLAAISMLGGSVAINPADAQASATYKRSKITKVKKVNYYSIKNAKTYKMIGSAKKIQLKANHNLKNYDHSTWVRTKKTTITKHGKKYLYYYVISQKNGVKGWVWHKYLKVGKNYQMADAKGLRSKDYIKAKSGKIYQLQGSNKYVKFTNGKAVSAKKIYKVTQQRHIYKNGKTYKYYYVTSGKASGWTWHKYLKVETPAKKGTGSSQTTSSSATKPINDDTYNASVVASAMISKINQARVQKGRVALVTDANLQSLGNQRAIQLESNFDHYNTDGSDPTEPIIKKLEIQDYYATEDITTGDFETTNDASATLMVTSYRNSSPHWNDLMNGDFTKIGVGLYMGKDGTLYNAIELGY